MEKNKASYLANLLLGLSLAGTFVLVLGCSMAGGYKIPLAMP